MINKISNVFTYKKKSLCKFSNCTERGHLKHGVPDSNDNQTVGPDAAGLRWDVYYILSQSKSHFKYKINKKHDNRLQHHKTPKVWLSKWEETPRRPWLTGRGNKTLLANCAVSLKSAYFRLVGGSYGRAACNRSSIACTCSRGASLQWTTFEPKWQQVQNYTEFYCVCGFSDTGWTNPDYVFLY